MFAGAGILWGAVTVFRGMRSWKQDTPKNSFPLIIVVGAVLVASCIGYLIRRI